MWAIVSQEWTTQLAEWIGERKVLEIMAGAGWLAKALSDCGVNIVATDSGDWDERHDKMMRLYPIKKHDAANAVRLFDADILICSWPPYGSDAICDAATVWGTERPIIYIGEGDGGCNAPEEFWEHFREMDNAPNIPLISWDGIHDHIFFGHYLNGG
jgi:hypothetical protein